VPLKIEKNNPQIANMKKAITSTLQLTPLEMLVRDIARTYHPEIKFQREALLHLRSVSEGLLLNVFAKAN
jgi:histone H3/H4